VALTVTVLLGTLYPLIREAYDGARISVGEPYFNTMSLPAMVAILFFMGVGPALPWGDGNLNRAGKRLAIPLAVSGIVGATLFALGVHDFWPLATFVTAAFAGVTSLRELVEPAVNRAKKKGENILVAWWQYASRSRAKVGAYTAHLGVVALAIGIGGSSGYKQVMDVTLTEGEPKEVLGYTLNFEGYESQQQPHRRSEVTWVRVHRGDRDLGLVDPRMNHYDTMAQPIGTPAVISAGPGYFGRLAPSEDLYLSLTRLSDDHRAVSVRVMTHPVIWWVWIGGLMLFGGGLMASWPGLVKQREKG
jgi:cytochrome c-type biogenesis protein CcmF